MELKHEMLSLRLKDRWPHKELGCGHQEIRDVCIPQDVCDHIGNRSCRMIHEDTFLLFAPFLPENTDLTIEETTISFMPKYIYRLMYTSKSSGRTMCMVAKGDTLPAEDGDCLKFYLRQLVLTPNESAREFSRLYFYERRARQDAFLRGESGNIRVSGKSTVQGESDGAVIEDKLTFKEYA